MLKRPHSPLHHRAPAVRWDVSEKAYGGWRQQGKISWRWKRKKSKYLKWEDLGMPQHTQALVETWRYGDRCTEAGSVLHTSAWTYSQREMTASVYMLPNSNRVGFLLKIQVLATIYVFDINLHVLWLYFCFQTLYWRAKTVVWHYWKARAQATDSCFKTPTHKHRPFSGAFVSLRTDYVQAMHLAPQKKSSRLRCAQPSKVTQRLPSPRLTTPQRLQTEVIQWANNRFWQG